MYFYLCFINLDLVISYTDDNRVYSRSCVWGWTTRIDSATWPFLKFDTATGASPKFDMRNGHLSDMRHGYFLKSTGDIGAKIVSDMGHGYFWLVTGNRALFLATLTCDMAVFKI